MSCPYVLGLDLSWIQLPLIGHTTTLLGFNRFLKKRNCVLIIRCLQNSFSVFFFIPFLLSFNSHLRCVRPLLAVSSFPTILYTMFRKFVSSTSWEFILLCSAFNERRRLSLLQKKTESLAGSDFLSYLCTVFTKTCLGSTIEFVSHVTGLLEEENV